MLIIGLGLSILLILIYAFYTQGYFTGEKLVFRHVYFFMSYWLPMIFYAFLFCLAGFLYLTSFKKLSFRLIALSSLGIIIDRFISLLFLNKLTIFSQILYSNWIVQFLFLIMEFFMPIIISIIAIKTVYLNEKKNNKHVSFLFWIIVIICNIIIILLSRIYIDNRFS